MILASRSAQSPAAGTRSFGHDQKCPTALRGNLGVANQTSRVKMVVESDANRGIQARVSRESANGEFSGSRCDRIFLNAAVWSEDVQRPAQRGKGSADSCWPTAQRFT